jgi:predicted dehydrogenase
LNYLIPEKPVSVLAAGISHTASKLENIAYLTMFYESNFIAHINVSWISPVKIRKTLIGGSRKMIVYDDIEPTEKVKIYDSNYQVMSFEDKSKMYVEYRVGDIFIPKLDTMEALNGLALDFVASIQTGAKPLSNAELGLTIVKTLEAAQKSIRTGNRERIL